MADKTKIYISNISSRVTNNAFSNKNSNNYSKENTLSKNFESNINTGKYSIARKLLEDNYDDSSKLNHMYGLLENIESNYNKSIFYYGKSMIDPYMQYKSLFALAKLNIQLGNYDIAKNMLETLMLNENYSVQTIFQLASLYFLEKEYNLAYEILNTINLNLLNNKQIEHYNIMQTCILYYLEKLPNYYNDHSYMKQRLFDKNDVLLLKHIERHKNIKNKYTTGCFFESIDLKELLEIAKSKISDMNPNHFEFSDMYRFKLDKEIGFKGNDKTKDICVTTLIGTKHILTMYPVLLSYKHDEEGMYSSKELFLKRNQGGPRIW